MVGCDKKLLSGKLLDRCLICGGDGSSCVLIKGLYNKNYRVYGKIKMASTVKTPVTGTATTSTVKSRSDLNRLIGFVNIRLAEK